VAQYKIHPIVTGTKVFDQGMMTYQHAYGRPYTIPIYSWYLEGGNETILVDTGEMHPIQSREREKAIGGKIHTFEEGLALWGLSPASIDIVIHTHLHNDHCENDYKCENAEIYVHEKELQRIHDPHPLDFRYLEDYIEEVEANGQIKPVSRGPGDCSRYRCPSHPCAYRWRIECRHCNSGRKSRHHGILCDHGEF
jgi:N-acyl homoserine lactone hydrolase